MCNSKKILLLSLLLFAVLTGCKKAKQNSVIIIAGTYVGNMEFHFTMVNTGGAGGSGTYETDTTIYSDTFYVTKGANDSFCFYNPEVLVAQDLECRKYDEKNIYKTGNDTIYTTVTFLPEKDSMKYDYANESQTPNAVIYETETFRGRKIN